MANAAQQLTELDNLLDGMDGLDALDALDFDTEEVVAESDENELLEAAQEDLADEVMDEEAVEEDLDALLADDSEEEAVEEEQEPDLEAIEADMKAEERQKRLDEATMTEEEAEAAKEAITAEKPAATVSDKPKSAPKEAIDCSDVLTSKVNPTLGHWELLSGVDPEDMRNEILEAGESLPKKTREKLVNLMDWWVRGANLSVYTKIGFELLIEEGEITGVSLRNRYMSNPGKAYSMGTANAQSGQIVKLFKTFKITTSDGKIDPDHEMVKRFQDVHGL